MKVRESTRRQAHAAGGGGVFATLRRQAHEDAFLLASLYLPTAALLLATAVVGWITGKSIGLLTGDPLAILHGHPLTGALSNLGVLVWCAAATICLFTWVVRRHQRASGRVAPPFLLASGLLMVFMMVDDLYQVHDALLPRYLGAPEEPVIVLYVLLTAGWLIFF